MASGSTESRMDSSRFKLPERYASQGATVWSEYGALAKQFKAVDVWTGSPDFPPPRVVTRALAEVTAEKDLWLHQYTRDFGHPRLVNVLSKMYKLLTNNEINPNTEMLITSGAFEALYCAISGHVEKGQEVIIIEPYFNCYQAMVLAANGVPRFLPLRPHGDPGKAENWKLDDKELEAMFNSNTKMIILNTPHNPIGKVFKRDELERIAELCKKWNVLCISDEVYEWMIYPGSEHVRICTLPCMWERTITIGSAGKSLSVTGWKTGWAYGPSKLMHNLRIVHQNCIAVHCTPIQEAIARVYELTLPHLNQPESLFSELVHQLLPKRDYMRQFLQDAGFKPILPEGGYFMIADWTELRNRCDLTEMKDEPEDFKFTKWIAEHVGAMAIPVSAFYSKDHKHLGEKYVRFCFVKKDENLQKAATLLKQWESK